jgi:hypothetical protein
MLESLTTGSGLLLWIKSNWLFLLFVVGLIGVFMFFRTKPSDIEDSAELKALLTDGQPTIVEFYSNF